MSIRRLLLLASVSAPSLETVPLSSAPDLTTIWTTGRVPAGEVNALDLLLAWGHLPGPDFSDPASIYDSHRPLGFRRPVYQSTRVAKRAAAGCPPRSSGRADDAKPRESSGTLTHWSANSPPALLSA